MQSLNFRQYGQKEQTKKAEQENSARESKRNIQYIHFLHKAEFIILSRMAVQNHTILQW